MATARLVHSAHLDGRRFTDTQLTLAIFASFFHDVGYIPKISEDQFTGTKLSLNVVNLSIDFVTQYFKKNKNFNIFSDDDLHNLTFMIKSTAFNFDATTIKYPALEIELLAKIVGAADLLGQMADRTYIEKLLHLFDEQFKEQLLEQDHKNSTPYDELELMKQTTKFHANLTENFGKNFSCVNKLMHLHFKERWNIENDLYEVAMNNNINYLKEIITKHGKNFKNHLHRH